ncbi:MAG TPA: DUF4199 domain-containing protein [Parafilimonas sp.]
METKVTTHITKGLVISLLLIVLNLVGHVLNIDLESWFGWIAVGIFIIAIAWSVNIYGKQMNYNVTFGNLFAHGFKTTAVGICITFRYTLLSVYLIFPDSIDRIVQKGMEKAIQDKKMTEDQVQQSLPMIKKITTITIIAGSILGNAIVGAVGALIGAAITKKQPQDPFGNQAI